jgi:hypothetical protein
MALASAIQELVATFHITPHLNFYSIKKDTFSYKGEAMIASNR